MPSNKPFDFTQGPEQVEGQIPNNKIPMNKKVFRF